MTASTIDTTLPVQTQVSRSTVKIITPVYVDTTVADHSETGVTIVDETGKGVFIPDEMSPVSTNANKKSNAQGNHQPSRRISVDALYPQWQDGKATAGIAVRAISQALNDLQTAAETSCKTSEEILNYLVLAESKLFQALDKSQFNKAFEIVVSFCAWAIRNAEFIDKLPSLQGMCSTLRELQDKPFLNSERATALIVQLEKMGWSGASPVSCEFEDIMASLS